MERSCHGCRQESDATRRHKVTMNHDNKNASLSSETHDGNVSINKCHRTDLIWLDFFLTFDCGPHQQLLHKLNYYGIPCAGVRLVYWSLRSTATFVICFHWSLLLAFSLQFSSSSAFLWSLFTQSSHLSCGLPRFLKQPCFFVSDLFGNLSSFLLTMCAANFIRLALNYFANYI